MSVGWTNYHICHSCFFNLHRCFRDDKEKTNAWISSCLWVLFPLTQLGNVAWVFSTDASITQAGLLEKYLAFMLLMFNLSLASRWHETASSSILGLPIRGRLSDRHRTAHPLCKPSLYGHEIRVAVATRRRLLLLHKWESTHSGSEVHILDVCRNYLRPVTFFRATGGQSDIILAQCLDP